MYTTKGNYGGGQPSYNAPTARYQVSYQRRQKKTIQYLGCTCGGNNPCRGTCRIFVTE